MTGNVLLPLVRRDIIVNILFGSHLYGTNTPNSDFDYKGVYVPQARDILLQRTPQSSIRNERRVKGHGEKNEPGEVELEIFTLQRFLALVAEGQTVALDMLFAPVSSYVGRVDTVHWVWQEIIDNRHRLISRKAASFVGYCRTQANKYGIKGSRVSAARTALTFLQKMEDQYGYAQRRLGELERGIQELVALAPEHSQIIELDTIGGGKLKHWEVCNRKLPYTATVKTCREVMQKIVDNSGTRALEAERNEGVDWKALSHAVRVGQEAIELLKTGHITFPLPNAALIRGIKVGDYEYKQVADEIERLLEKVERAAEESNLPTEPDKLWIDDFVATVHLRQIEGKL